MNHKDHITPINDLSEDCVICLEKKSIYASIPCGHLKYCETCIKIVQIKNECAICRSHVDSICKIFF